MSSNHIVNYGLPFSFDASQFMVGWIKFVTMFLSALSLVLLIYRLHTSNIPGSGLDYDYTDFNLALK